ncbi:MAG: hypothetical protein H7Z40_06305 [Phycisphaerae bacterium]|nr:hypothetical protein [Gemmatimonadaceae bacterium]
MQYRFAGVALCVSLAASAGAYVQVTADVRFGATAPLQSLVVPVQPLVTARRG